MEQLAWFENHDLFIGCCIGDALEQHTATDWPVGLMRESVTPLDIQVVGHGWREDVVLAVLSLFERRATIAPSEGASSLRAR
jgi:hypothetical protein